VGVPLARIRSLECVPRILRAKSTFGNNDLERLKQLEQSVAEEMDTLAKEYVKEATFDVDMHATMI
jgi:hypothetical protein